ncbi:MAG: zinc ribbon domain-containing protein [Bacteroidota bacterium]|jgi:zinc ribbon domain-containing protein
MATKKKTEVKEEEVKEVKVATKTAKSSKSETSASVQNQQELSVEDRLKSLYQLQKVMSKIDEIKILRGDLPIEIQDLEDEVLGLHTRLERYTTEIKDNEKKIAAGKNAIEEAKLKLDKKAEQQKQVVNNREYEILSKEIENLELDIQIYEKNINDANYEIENKKSELETLSALIEEKNEDLRLKKTELDQIIVETKKEEEDLRVSAKNLEDGIDNRLLTAFKRIRKNARNGLAVVPIERNACSGCFSKVPPQRQLDIRQRKKIIVCENCGRIIVDHEMTDE